MTSQYEQIRLRNIADNKRILAELGLVNPFKPLPRIIKTKRNGLKRKRDYEEERPPLKRQKTSLVSASPNITDSWKPGTRRRSQRLQGKDAAEIKDIEDDLLAEDEDEKDEEFRSKPPKDRPHVYGAIPGVDVGSFWLTRIEANHAGVHRPTVAGIHPGPDGAYSIALSGGYEDDIDLGECFTYTGEGGRDLKGTKSNPKNLRTAPQSKDQLLSRGNKALVRSVETGQHVRVLRGYKLDSPFAPEEGYRYDGLYKVDKWWYTIGLAGFSVYKFVLSRVKDQPPPPWTMNLENDDGTGWGENSTDAEKQQKDEDGNGQSLKENGSEEGESRKSSMEEKEEDSKRKIQTDPSLAINDATSKNGSYNGHSGSDGPTAEDCDETDDTTSVGDATSGNSNNPVEVVGSIPENGGQGDFQNFDKRSNVEETDEPQSRDGIQTTQTNSQVHEKGVEDAEDENKNLLMQ